MAFIGTILQEVVKMRRSYVNRKYSYYTNRQSEVLLKLLTKAQNTEFGKYYNFKEILRSPNPDHWYRKNVPIFDYNKMHDEWWHKSLDDKKNVTWPGRIKHFALTSGTSEAASKRVPVTRDMIHCIRNASVKQILTLGDLDLGPEFYQKSCLMLGGSTDLTKVGQHYEGDLSGILTDNLPVWFHKFYKPGAKISTLKDWESKLEAIVKKAPNWDIAIISGVPAWIQILIERIIERYNVSSIHDIWPNFTIYVHGGVAFAPYKDNFEKLLGKKIYYLDTYLASEGFMAFENAYSKMAMQMVLNRGIYFEFIPFNDQNFDSDGSLKPNAETLLISEVKENQDYALLISTCSGVWRYLIGDTIRFINLDNYEIIISGRTKHFLSLCGEHLSVDNMNRAIELTSSELDLNIKEFTVAGIHHDGLFAHRWFIGTDQKDIDKNKVKSALDKHLKGLNDDYITERKHALKDIFIHVLPNEVFYDWMKHKGKEGGQHKFPRVLKGKTYEEWLSFLSQHTDLKLDAKEKA